MNRPVTLSLRAVAVHSIGGGQDRAQRAKL